MKPQVFQKYRKLVFYSRSGKTVLEVGFKLISRPRIDNPALSETGVSLCFLGSGPTALGDFWGTQCPVAAEILAKLKEDPYSKYRYYERAEWI